MRSLTRPFCLAARPKTERRHYSNAGSARNRKFTIPFVESVFVSNLENCAVVIQITVIPATELIAIVGEKDCRAYRNTLLLRSP